RVIRQSMTRVAAGRLRLETREEFAADALRIRIRVRQAIAVPVSCERIAAELGKRRLEGDVPRECFVRCTHPWVADVVARAVHVSEADQLAAAELRAIAAYRTIGWVRRWQP